MKLKLFTLLFSLLLGHSLGAQSATASDAELRKNTEALTTKYSLTADQAKRMYQVQVRKNNQMAEIAALQSSDPTLYLSKYSGIQKATWEHIRRILNNKSQVDIYRKTQADLDMRRKAKRKELVQQKAAKDVIETAVLAIYAE